MSREGESRSIELEALRGRAEKQLQSTNDKRAEIIATLRGTDDEENKRIAQYLTDVDESLLEWARGREIFEELVDVFDELELEMGKMLTKPELREAYDKIGSTAQELGQQFNGLSRTGTVFFRHFISELRSILLILREQTKQDPTGMIVDRTEDFLGAGQEDLMKVDTEGGTFEMKKNRRAVELEGAGVDPLIAGRRALVELRREARDRARELNAWYVKKIKQIYGLKDGELPV